MNTERNLSADARSAKLDRLDEAIDQVAERLTRVEDNARLAVQIISALPERATWFGWLFHSWAPRLAVIAVVVVSGIVWGSRREASTPSASPLASSQPLIAPTALVASVREAEPNRTMPLERVESLEPLKPARADFDRSLAAIAPPAALSLKAVAPSELPGQGALAVEPLVIADLPFTAENISPR